MKYLVLHILLVWMVLIGMSSHAAAESVSLSQLQNMTSVIDVQEHLGDRTSPLDGPLRINQDAEEETDDRTKLDGSFSGYSQTIHSVFTQQVNQNKCLISSFVDKTQLKVPI